MDANNIWRLNLKPGNAKSHQEAFEYCIDNGIIGGGWGLEDEPYCSNVKLVFDDHLNRRINSIGKDDQWSVNTLKPFFNAMNRIQKNDLVWIRNNGIYYICRIDGEWQYDSNQLLKKHDIYNFYQADIQEVGTLDFVPGKVANSFIPSRTLQAVYGDDIKEYSKRVYNSKSSSPIYNVSKVSLKYSLDLLQPEDLEELISLYLQVEKGYLLYSSTNKVDTQTYEFVMVKNDGSHRAYTQVKSGNSNILDGNDYIKLVNPDIMYIYSSECINYDNQFTVRITDDDLLIFVKIHESILPRRIKLIWNI